MSIRLIGAVLIISGCGGYGFMLAKNHRREVRSLRQLLGILEFMTSELQYKLTPLPELCRCLAEQEEGWGSRIFEALGRILEAQVYPNVPDAMDAAVKETKGIPLLAAAQLRTLGKTLGRFDLVGQLRGIESCRVECLHQLEDLEQNQTQRLRSYQTLSFCAGVALAILLI